MGYSEHDCLFTFGEWEKHTCDDCEYNSERETELDRLLEENKDLKRRLKRFQHGGNDLGSNYEIKQLKQLKQEKAELVEAFEEAIQWNWLDGDVPEEICEKIDTALAKAKGES